MVSGFRDGLDRTSAPVYKPGEESGVASKEDDPDQNDEQQAGHRDQGAARLTILIADKKRKGDISLLEGSSHGYTGICQRCVT